MLKEPWKKTVLYDRYVVFVETLDLYLTSPFSLSKSSSMILFNLSFSSLQIKFSSKTSSIVLKTNVSLTSVAAAQSFLVSSFIICNVDWIQKVSYFTCQWICWVTSFMLGPACDQESIKANLKSFSRSNFSDSCFESSLLNHASLKQLSEGSP